MSPFFILAKDQIDQLVGEAVLAYGIVPASIAWGVIQVESGGDVWAWNPEPKWRWFWNVRTNKAFRAVTPAEVASEKPPRDFPSPRRGVDPDAEWWGQQASWGLMQIMGAVARENGFSGPFLNALHDPAINIQIGCKVLAGYARRYLGKYGWEGVLRAYNGGPYAVVHNTNPEYPARVCEVLGGRLPNA